MLPLHARLSGFAAQWEQRWKRWPTRAELAGVINAYVREEILYRQAVSIGLNKDDPVTRRRMAQKLEFLTSNIALAIEPEDGELEKFFEDNSDLYQQPDVISYSQVFLDPDKRDDATLGDADDLLKKLQAAGVPDPEILSAGDRFMLPGQFADVTEMQVRRLMGNGFSETLMQLAPGRWHGPVLSGYGVHLVYVYERQTTPPPNLADVRTAVLLNWREQQQKKFTEDFYQSLKNNYEVRIADLPEEKLFQVGGGSKLSSEAKLSGEESK